MRKAGQKIAWKRVMSLPMTWASIGQNRASGAAGSGQPVAVR